MALAPTDEDAWYMEETLWDNGGKPFFRKTKLMYGVRTVMCTGSF